MVLTWTLLLKFWLTVAAIKATAWMVPGFHVPWLSAMFLAVLITALVAFVETLSGSRYAPYTIGIFAWSTGVLIVYTRQWILPGVDSTWIGAIVAGSVLWALGLVVPKIWG